MIPFAKELKAKMTGTSNHCNQSAQQPQCPESVMEIEQEDGWRNFQNIVLRNADYQPLVFGAGFGTTATHAMYEATCHLQLRSLHYDLNCGLGTSLEYATPGLLAHARVIRAYESLVFCTSRSQQRGAKDDCPSVSQAMDSMRLRIDKVLSSKDVDAIHDTPYPEFADYIIPAVERIRGAKPIVLLSERQPEEWASKRMNDHDGGLICR